MPAFEPKLFILSDVQRRLWGELSDMPIAFALCGGTAVALQLGHRASFDFDFIGAEEFDPDQLFSSLPFLRGSKTVQKAANTLTCLVDRGGPVPVSFFGAPTIQLIELPLVAAENGLRIVSLTDLSAMKAAAVQKRAEEKDYRDIDAIISEGGIDLPTALAAARTIYGAQFNPQLTLKSLSFFGDGNLHRLPREVQDRLAAASRAVDLDRLPKIERRSS